MGVCTCFMLKEKKVSVLIKKYILYVLHRKKRFTSFPSPAGMSLTKLRLGRNNSVMTLLFPPRESLVVTSRLGTGKSQTFFYGVILEGRGKYLFSCGRKGKVYVLIKKKRKSICSHKEEKRNYLFS
jgi:hypothetical protein